MLRKQSYFAILLATLILLATASEGFAQFTISGTVTDAALLPAAGVDILLYDGSGNPIGITPTLTDILGVYTIANIPPGNYEVGFEPPSALRLLTAQIPVTVVGNTVLNATLTTGALLTGFVRDTLGVGIFDVDLNVYDQATRVKTNTPGDNTDIFGFYDIVVPIDTLRIRWRSATGDPWLPIELQNVIVTGDTAIDVIMSMGAVLTGNVTGPLSVPVVNADIDIIQGGIKLFTPNDITLSDGSYEVVVPIGTIDIVIEPLPADKLVAKKDTGIVVLGAMSYNMVLQAGFALSGSVKDGNGLPVQDININVTDLSTGVKLITPSDFTDAAGNYSIVVPGGNLKVSFIPPISTRLAPFVQSPFFVGSDMIFNVVVPNGMVLSGIIKNPLGLGVASVDIDVKDAITGFSLALAGDFTDATGSFSTVFVPGTYNVEIEPPDSLRLVSKLLPGIPFSGADTTILVTLENGVVLTGFVTDSLGSPVGNVDIDVAKFSTGDSVFNQFDTTDGLGFYSLIVPTTNLNLRYKPPVLSGIADTVDLIAVPVIIDTSINVAFVGQTAACCIGITGNVDADAGQIIDIGDLTALITFLFIPPNPPPPCIEEANIDGDLGGVVDIGDLTALISFLFVPPNNPPLPCQ